MNAPAERHWLASGCGLKNRAEDITMLYKFSMAVGFLPNENKIFSDNE
jgi:hypothetical protein